MNFLEKLLKTILNKNLFLYNFLVTLITLFFFFGILFFVSLFILAISNNFVNSTNADASSFTTILFTIIIPVVIGILDLALCLFILIVNLKFKNSEEKYE